MSNSDHLKLFGFNISKENKTVSNFKEPQPSVDSSESGNPPTPKFECRYCCREFSNSQALGGHQNAHKEERQLLKTPQIKYFQRNNFTSLHVQSWMLSSFAPPPPLMVVGAPPPPVAGLYATSRPPFSQAGVGDEDVSGRSLGLDLQLSLGPGKT